MRRLLLALLLAVTLPLSTEAGCRLETAQVEVVQPATVRVLAVWRCGGVTCWERWVESKGRRLGQSRICESGRGDLLEVKP